MEINIDNLSTNLGLWHSIQSYDANNKDMVHRAYLVKEPHQLKKYKISQPIMGNIIAWRFNPKWFEEYPQWLEYSA